MKNRTIKVLFMLAVTVTMMISLSVVVSAAKPIRYITTPRYMTLDEIRYTSVAKDVADGEVVTHYAVDVADSWVYFNQEKVTGATRDVTFVYYADEDTLDADMRFGDAVNTNDDYASLRDRTDSSNYLYITEGLHVHVSVNGVATGVESVMPEQEPGLKLTRTVDVPAGTNTLGIPAGHRITSVTFQACDKDGSNPTGTPSTVADYAFTDYEIILNECDLVVTHGILNITTEAVVAPSVDLDRYNYDNSGVFQVSADPDTIDFLAKYTASEEYEYGVVIAEKEETINETVLNTAGKVFDAQVDDDRTALTKLGDGAAVAVAFKANAKNGDNEFAVTVEEILDYLKANVEYRAYAYIKLAGQYVAIESEPGYIENGLYTGEEVKYNTVVFKLDTDGNCIRVLN